MIAHTRQGKGPPLVLVHGFLGGSAMWAAQRAAFAPVRDVICPDLAGFGDSADQTAPDRIEGHAAQVLALLDHLGIGQFDLLGHSMGGMVVQEMARMAPSRVANLVLYGTGPQGVLPGRFETIDQSRLRFGRDGVAQTARRIAATWFLAGEDAGDFALCRALGERVSLDTALASLTAWQAWDGRPGLAQITARSLILWGSQDRSYPWSQPFALWQGIAGADLAVVPGAAHNVHFEKPALFNRLVADFLGMPVVA